MTMLLTGWRGNVGAAALAAARADGRVALPGDGGARWSTCHVADWGALLVLAAEAIGPGQGPIFAATSSARIADIADIAEALAGRLALPLFPVSPDRAGEAGPFGAALLLDQEHDGSAARKRLGWSPRHETFAATLLEGIEPDDTTGEWGPS